MHTANIKKHLNFNIRQVIKWRRRWDSNPRYAWTYDSFQDCSNQPLWHSSIRLFGCISILFAEKFLSTSSFSNLLADSRTWTDDLLITNELLYQLSYIGLLYTDFIFKHLASILCRAKQSGELFYERLNPVGVQFRVVKVPISVIWRR